MPSNIKPKLDYSDYLGTPDDGNRYEIPQGELYVSPLPTPVHQRVSKRLARQLEAYFEERSLGEVFSAPIALILTSGDIAGPDLLVVTDASQITERGIEGPRTTGWSIPRHVASSARRWTPAPIASSCAEFAPRADQA